MKKRQARGMVEVRPLNFNFTIERTAPMTQRRGRRHSRPREQPAEGWVRQAGLWRSA